MAKRDYYEVLGISKSADEKEIKRAYRKLAKKYHPDTNQGDKIAEQKFKEASEAYDILSDPEKKKLYDRFGFAAFDGSMGSGAENTNDGFGGRWSSGSSGFGNGGQYQEYHFTGGSVDDVFDDLFGGSFGGGFRSGFGQGSAQGFRGKAHYGAQQGRNLESEITISFEEAAFGCKKRIKFEGTQAQSLEVNIPAGIDEGQSVRLKGKGYPGNGGMADGDLLLKVHISEKSGYERKGLDVYTTEKIPYTTAVLGGDAVFHTLYGDVTCKVPAGTQSGSKIRLRQKGIVSMKNPAVRGDAYVVIQIQVPKHVSPRERKLLEELRNAG